MAWTAPRTWVTGEILSSTNLNAQVRDNLLFLFSAAIPTGTILDYGGLAAPTGYLLCDGSAVSRTTFSDLFAALSTRYGVGDGSTTFNLPDLRGRGSVGYAVSGGHADVSTLGANDGVAVAFRRPKHQTSQALTLPNHTHNYGQHGGGASTGGGFASGSVDAGVTATYATGNPNTLPAIAGTVGTANANDAVDTAPYLVVNKMVKT